MDYLLIKKRSELAIARASAVPQKDIPRKTDNSGIGGAARGRDGLIRDLAEEMIPYTSLPALLRITSDLKRYLEIHREEDAGQASLPSPGEQYPLQDAADPSS